MADITAGMVKDLRETTGAGMMDCKKALQETGGDMSAAQDWLRTKGLAKAANKAGRVAAEGLVAVALRDQGAGMTGAAIELNSETDFVARNELFQSAARRIAQTALDVTGDVEALRAAKTQSGETVADLITQLIATVGENMGVRRFVRFEVGEGAIGAYVHNKVEGASDIGRIGVLVAVEGSGDKAALAELGRNVALHAAAARPLSLSADDLDPADVAKEKTILTEQALESGKPAGVVEKMVEGRIRKWMEEVVLTKQAYVRNPDQTIEQLVAETAKQVGSPVTLKAFARVAVGEGVEKKTESLADEVAALSGAR
jgi:elongation factor Ts